MLLVRLPMLLVFAALLMRAPVAFAAAPAQDTCSLAQLPPWHQVKSAHFNVRTSLQAEAARNATMNLERFLAALLPMWGPRFELEGPLDVLLLRDTELAEFAQGHVRGFLTHGSDESQLIVIALEAAELAGSPRALPSITHELAHALIDRTFPGAPRWFSEGLATYLESIEVSAGGHEAVEGYLQLGHLKYVRAHGVLDMEAMWRWEEDRSLHDQVKLQHQYASAWLWTHYLLKRHPERLGRFELALSRLEEPREAWREAFGQVTDLEEGLKAHAAAAYHEASSYAPREVPSKLEVRVLPHPEVHVLRARLWSKVPNSALGLEERRRRLEPEVRQAMREDGANVEVVWLQSELLDTPREKLKLAQALVEARPDDARAWTLLGRALRLTRAPPLEQEKAFLKAMALMPESTSTLFDVALYYAEQKLPDKALEPAIRAVELAPGSAAMRSVLAQVLLDRGQCEQGLLHLRRTLVLARHRPDASEVIASLTRALARYEAACGKAMKAAGTRPEQSL